MFELLADSTPNARKISIMLEEIQKPYDVKMIDISKGDQHNNINPNKMKTERITSYIGCSNTSSYGLSTLMEK